MDKLDTPTIPHGDAPRFCIRPPDCMHLKIIHYNTPWRILMNNYKSLYSLIRANGGIRNENGRRIKFFDTIR
jgi:hypothetical protein